MIRPSRSEQPPISPSAPLPARVGAGLGLCLLAALTSTAPSDAAERILIDPVALEVAPQTPAAAPALRPVPKRPARSGLSPEAQLLLSLPAARPNLAPGAVPATTKPAEARPAAAPAASKPVAASPAPETRAADARAQSKANASPSPSATATAPAPRAAPIPAVAITAIPALDTPVATPPAPPTVAATPPTPLVAAAPTPLAVEPPAARPTPPVTTAATAPKPMAAPAPVKTATPEPAAKAAAQAPAPVKPAPSPLPAAQVAKPIKAAASATPAATANLPPQRLELIEPAAGPEPAPAAALEPQLAMAPANLPIDSVRVGFARSQALLDDKSRAVLSEVVNRIKDNGVLRLQLVAYAQAEGDGASQARRLSLTRALAVRSYLIEQGIRSTRMDVRALGPSPDGGPADRVDVLVVKP